MSKYTKPALSWENQADLLIDRGLMADRNELIFRLKSISYYRLSGYTYPFKKTDDTFEAGTTLATVWSRYTFDRQLRLLVLDAIERVEIALRTDLVYRFSHTYGPFGYLLRKNFPYLKPDEHKKMLKGIRHEYRKSKEQFIGHFKNKYGKQHFFPPLWMATELMSLGALLTMFRGVPKSIQQSVASRYGVSDTVFMSWLRALKGTRNVCAHHARLFDRIVGYKPLIPKRKKHPDWHTPFTVRQVEIFGVLTVLKYCLGIVAPQSQWPQRFKKLMEDYPDIPRQAMGMPQNWLECAIWK